MGLLKVGAYLGVSGTFSAGYSRLPPCLDNGGDGGDDHNDEDDDDYEGRDDDSHDEGGGEDHADEDDYGDDDDNVEKVRCTNSWCEYKDNICISNCPQRDHYLSLGKAGRKENNQGPSKMGQLKMHVSLLPKSLRQQNLHRPATLKVPAYQYLYNMQPLHHTA
ncbi:hypothetical protein PoB_003101600 [Plakobranchus ocellatus]|uniref:Uncharacterized protein n=1 Tax=Plakobranchus ocellatus TaxID=259542 RepID=A0AAV3ZZV2_9GAST|nr:hypothetical protein PoB_003101600 [Plakobranchus ocellatus]